jgi:hypothetical protein
MGPRRQCPMRRWIVLAELCVVAPSCARPPGLPLEVRAGEAAVRSGITQYALHRVEAHHLGVGLMGILSGDLTVDVFGGAATQHLALADRPPFDLETSKERVGVTDGTRRFLMSKNGSAWTMAGPSESIDRSIMQLLMAVDVDLGVQGATMVFDGSLYAPCTVDCMFAEKCVGAARLATCASDVVTCAACLEQEP